MALEPGNTSHEQHALNSLAGLAVGDAFGAAIGEGGYGWLANEWEHAALQPPWFYTDDTVMAQSVVQVLRECGKIDQDRLAWLFADRYVQTPNRGYGNGAARLLIQIHRGADWRTAAPAMFQGTGSYGNGAAMRVAPIGAWFAHDLDALRTAAIASAEVTHAHPEGVAGALAVALLAGSLTRSVEHELSGGRALLTQIANHLEPGQVKTGILDARDVPLETDPFHAAERLGNGRQVSAQDTVPFSLWCAVRHADNFQAALWSAAAAGGDRDTICAIVGGIVACRVGLKGIPVEWRRATEPWDEW